MPEFVSYAVKYAPLAKKTRDELPDDMLKAMLNIVDILAENPDARPDRTQSLTPDSPVRIYTHPQPALQVTYQVDPQGRVLLLLHFAALRVQVTKPVFISYCHKDAEWLTKLKMFLRPLEDRGLIKVWDDTEIRPGSEWFEEIRHSLESARVAVFLVTQDFLDSVFIREKELPPLLERASKGGCQVFWIAVSASTVEDSEMAKYQAANNPKQPLDRLPQAELNEALKSIYDRMKEAVQI
jgi:hypothetical protein